MKGIEENVQLLTGYRVTKLATQDSITAMQEDISAIPSLLLNGIRSSATAETERDSLLKALRWTDPIIDKLRIERTKGGLHEASSSWTLSHPSYQKWRDDDTNKLLWMVPARARRCC
ncbi:hypothetical protein B0T25DRAFT_529797 [Lasiosphaeria hispida]|uniref:Uncharacterized protein n=1 Tax=Lasiosphaeria hispida TaxID=260671 RepID=A0AAJ0HXA7_9PEZI|nr:hypothetical protein B0T25DRAFT_529797 [Lasiosphaeria hispida]